MSRCLRSRFLAVVVFINLSICHAQPNPGGRTSELERIVAAHNHLHAGSLTRSLTAFDHLVDPLRLSAWDPRTQLARIDVLSRLRPRQNTDPALKEFVSAYASSPLASYALISRGLGALQRNEPGQARLRFGEAVAAAAETDIENVDGMAAGTAYYWLGIAHLADREATLDDQAAQALKTSSNDYPRNPFADDALFALGQMSESAGELDSALGFYNRIVEEYRGSDLRLEATLRAAQTNLRLNRIDLARQLLASVSADLGSEQTDRGQYTFQTAEYHLLLAAAGEYAGDYAAAERSYLAVVSTIESPYRRAALVGLADTYHAAGQGDSAMAIFQRVVVESRSDAAGMYADFKLATATIRPPYAPEELAPLRAIAFDSTHGLMLQARLTLAGIHYLRQEFSLTEELLDSWLAPPGQPALRSKALVLRGVNRMALLRFREADDDMVQALRVARATPLALMPERDTLVAHASLAGAIAMIHASRPADAVPQLNRLLQTPLPEALAAEATYWLGEAYYAAGVLPASVQTMEDLIEHYPASTRIEDALYAIGWAQLHQRKLDRAEAAFGRLVKAYPLTVYATEAQLRRGDCLYLLKKYALAADVYQLADSAGAHPELVEYARYQTALAQYHDNNRATARGSFSRFADQYPQSDLRDDAVFMVGLIDYIDRRYSEAVATFDALQRNHGLSTLIARARTMMAASYYALGHFDSSRAVAQSVLDDFQESSYVGEAQSALDRARTAIAAEDRKRAKNAARTDDNLDRANNRRQSEHSVDAVAEFDSTRVMSRDDILDSANTRAQSGHSSESVAEFDTTRAMSRDDILDSANNLSQSKHSSESIAEFDTTRAFSLDGEALAKATLETALTNMQTGDTVAALDALRRAAVNSQAPSGRAAVWNLANYYHDMHETDSAVAYYQRIAVDDSTSSIAHLRIGQVYLGNEQWALALDAFSSVVDAAITPALIAEAQLGIAEVRAGQGDVDRAREMFLRLVREQADDEIVKRAEQQLRNLENL